ncbi:MAG: hypothetical protein HY706_20515, partial [Candidatus Hydrogenedentes bacterium]|nr:hypothetical protein [Candidatus Hydrogenedentota bacterium]
RVTHEEYFRRFGSDFGSTITHAFMDEAGMCPRAGWLPWDMRFSETFEQRRGYPLLPHLPALFFDVPGCEAVRFDYWSLAAELFREGFAIPMHEWCTRHHIAYTGHYVFETTLKEATRMLGATMPLYEYQGLPGIDILGNDFYSHRFEQEAYGYYVVNIKQAASVSHQLGKGGLMSESYGVGGHAMGPDAMQTATNFQMALGVTFINQHAAFYSLRGDRKLDCPPVIGWQEPYWPFARKHLDTTSRTGWLLSQGQHVCEVLLLHPASSMQATYRHFRVRNEYKAENYFLDADLPFELVDKHFTLLSVALLDAQIDFDYGDEEILARYASASDGCLRVGQESYRLIVVPPSINIRASTLALLETFARPGGIILTVGSLPNLVDGRPSRQASDFFRSRAHQISVGVDLFQYASVVEALTRLGARTATLKTLAGDDVPSLKVQRRAWNGREILYLANVSRESVEAQLIWNVNVTGTIEEWGLDTGNCVPLAPCRGGEPFQMPLQWAPRQARALVAVPGKAHLRHPRSQKTQRRIHLVWTAQRNQANILLLDECHVVENGLPGSLVSIYGAQKILQEKLTLQQVPATVTTRYAFTVSNSFPIATPIELAFEYDKAPAVFLNGKPVVVCPVGSMLDPAIRRIRVPSLRPGENVIDIQAVHESHTHLQSPWLLGSFRVRSDGHVHFRLEPDANDVGLGSWPELGLPFYAGSVTYRADLEFPGAGDGGRVLLEAPGLVGSAEIRVNGVVVDHILWPPYECDLAGHVMPGKNAIEIEVANTLRNLLGPHFDPEEALHTGYSGRHYMGSAGQPKHFLPYGILTAPSIVLIS